MGCQIGANGDASSSLRWSAAGYLVMRLTARWLDPARDCDSDGWHQVSIDKSAISTLNAEAPTGPAEFRQYCLTHDGQDYVGKMDDDELATIREFITEADRAGEGVWCSH